MNTNRNTLIFINVYQRDAVTIETIGSRFDAVGPNFHGSCVG